MTRFKRRGTRYRIVRAERLWCLQVLRPRKGERGGPEYITIGYLSGKKNARLLQEELT